MRQILLVTFSIFLSVGCIFDGNNSQVDEGTGTVSLQLMFDKSSHALSKTSSGTDTTYKLDTILVRISSPGLSDSVDRIITTARPDTGLVVIPTKNYVLRALHTYKFKIVTIDTAVNPLRRDTIHIDSITNVYLGINDVVNSSKILNARYSVLKVLMRSDSASFITNNFKFLRIKVDGSVQDTFALNSKTFSQILSYRYLTPGISHTVVLQAFDTTSRNRGYEKTFTIVPQVGRDTLIVDSISVMADTLQAGSLTTLTLDATASSVNNFYKGMMIKITAGKGVGQTRTILSYVGNTKVATVATFSGASTTPNSTSIYLIYHKNMLTPCGGSFTACTP